MNFLVGLFLGAILGVAADRIWSYFEKRPRFHLKIGYYEGFRGDRGHSYTVRNVGTSEIPDYKIGLFHPNRGTLFIFPSEQNGPLLPDQIRDHQCALFRNGKSNDFIRKWLTHECDVELDEVTFTDFSIRIVMENSNNILFESRKMGNAIAKHWHETVTTGEWAHSSWEDDKQMSSPPPFGLKYWRERREQMRQFKEMEKLHENAG